MSPAIDISRDPYSHQLALREAAKVDTSKESGGDPEKKIEQLFDDYRPHAGQVELHESKANRLAVVAGRRGGKTYGGGREFLKRVYHDLGVLQAAGLHDWEEPEKFTDATKPALHYWIVAPTYGHTAFQVQEIFEVLGGEESCLVLDYTPSKYTIWLKGGVKIGMKSAERPKRLVAAGLHGVWIDEAARVKRDTWDDNIRGALTEYGGWAMFTTTPLGTANWLYQDIWKKTGKAGGESLDEYEGVRFHTADNTAVPGIQEEVEKARRELPDPIFRRNYLADFHAFKGKVFPNFLGEAPHVVQRIPHSALTRKVGGVDWGWNNPGVLLEIGIDARGTWWVMREHYHSERLKKPSGDDPTRGTWQGTFEQAHDQGVRLMWADPSEPETIKSFQNEDLPVRPAKNAVKPGIDAVGTMLHDGPDGPKLRIHKRCEHLISELSSYKWKDDQDEPVKENDHTVDALRYAVFSELKSPRGIGALDDFSIFSS